jgi:hypothetical protein
MSIKTLLKLAKNFEKQANSQQEVLSHIDSIISVAHELKQNMDKPEEFLDLLSALSEDFDKLLEYGNALNNKILSGELE